MNKTKIEWCDYTWNPVVGCKHGCEYCYAERMNKRFKWIKNWKEPEFFQERIDQLMNSTLAPSKIFVGSMCDLFGGWIHSKWIGMVLQAIYNFPEHEFMFLTKNPSRYNEFNFYENCWLGTTVEIPNWKGMQRLMDFSAIATPSKKFISIEPLLGSFMLNDLQQFDLVIVGAMTGPGAIKPKREWIESIKSDNIFYKENIKQYL